MFISPLPSDRRQVVARVGLRGNVFTESFPTNGCTSHNMSREAYKSRLDIFNSRFLRKFDGPGKCKIVFVKVV
jgi:hypothetical protein